MSDGQLFTILAVTALTCFLSAYIRRLRDFYRLVDYAELDRERRPACENSEDARLILGQALSQKGLLLCHRAIMAVGQLAEQRLLTDSEARALEASLRRSMKKAGRDAFNPDPYFIGDVDEFRGINPGDPALAERWRTILAEISGHRVALSCYRRSFRIPASTNYADWRTVYEYLRGRI